MGGVNWRTCPPDVRLSNRKHLTRDSTLEQIDDITTDRSAKDHSISTAIGSERSITKQKDENKSTENNWSADVLGRPKRKMPPPPKSNHTRQGEQKVMDSSIESPCKTTTGETDTSHSKLLCTPEPERSVTTTEVKFKHSDIPATPMGRLLRMDSKEHAESSHSHSKPVDPSIYSDYAPKGNNKQTLNLGISSGTDLDQHGFRTERDDPWGLFAPQPYRNRQSVSSLESGAGNSKVTRDSNSKLRRAPRPVSMTTVPADSTLQRGKTEPKLLRRRSHLDRRLDEQIDKAYSEELTRRASLPTERGRSADRDSSSGLSALATYEEHHRVKQIEDILRPGGSKDKSSAATQHHLGLRSGNSKDSPKMGIVAGHSNDTRIRSHSDDHTSNSAHSQNHVKSEKLSLAQRSSQDSGREKASDKQTFEQNKPRYLPNENQVRDDAKKKRFTDPGLITQSKSKGPNTETRPIDNKPRPTDPNETSETKIKTDNESNLRHSGLLLPSDIRNKRDSGTKSDPEDSVNAPDLTSPFLTESKFKTKKKITEPFQGLIHQPGRNLPKPKLDINLKPSENPEEVTVIGWGTKDRNITQENLKKLKRDSNIGQHLLPEEEKLRSDHNISKRRTLNASDLNRLFKGQKTPGDSDDILIKESGNQKRPRSSDGIRSVKDHQPMGQKIPRSKLSEREDKIAEIKPKKIRSKHGFDPTEHALRSGEQPATPRAQINGTTRSNRTEPVDSKKGKSKSSRGIKSLETNGSEKQLAQLENKSLDAQSPLGSPIDKPAQIKEKYSGKTSREKLPKVTGNM